VILDIDRKMNSNPCSEKAFIHIAIIRLMLHRLA
jgi:hypothetical protein